MLADGLAGTVSSNPSKDLTIIGAAPCEPVIEPGGSGSLPCTEMGPFPCRPEPMGPLPGAVALQVTEKLEVPPESVRVDGEAHWPLGSSMVSAYTGASARPGSRVNRSGHPADGGLRPVKLTVPKSARA